MKIITLTLNPAFDVHCQADSFELYKENLADITEKDAGGKGINISRALCEFDVPNVAYVVLGSDNGADFEAQLKKYGLNYRALRIDGRIRENITVHTENNPETRLSFRGFSATDSIIDELEEKIFKELEEDTYIVFAGSVPQGISKERILRFLSSLKEKGIKLIIDSKSITKEELLMLKPYLIKPNEEEVSAYIGHNVQTFADCIEGAKYLNDSGIENAMISLGKKGAMTVTDGEVYTAKPPLVEAVSTIGAGDSSIAGFLYAKYNKKGIFECLKNAVAFGTAACLKKGTNPPSRADVEKIIERIEHS